jgi:hypothetical protein
MMTGNRFKPFLALASFLVFAAPAVGQPPVEETDCIYNALSDKDVVTVVDDALLSTEDTKREADAIFLKARTACVALFSWTPKQADAAETIAFHTAVIDVLGPRLGTVEDLDRVFDILVAMPVEDQLRFIKDDWAEDDTFTNKIVAKLVAAGFAEENGEVEDAVNVMESSVLIAAATATWPKN